MEGKPLPQLASSAQPSLLPLALFGLDMLPAEVANLGTKRLSYVEPAMRCSQRRQWKICWALNLCMPQVNSSANLKNTGIWSPSKSHSFLSLCSGFMRPFQRNNILFPQADGQENHA